MVSGLAGSKKSVISGQKHKISIGMKKFGLVIFTLTLVMGHVMAQSDVSQARWQDTPVVIDGNDQEWEKPLNFYDGGSGLLYAISNGTDKLYLTFVVSDMRKMGKMMTSGWTLQLSAKDKKNKIKASLIFPAVKMEQMGNRGEVPMAGSLNAENPMIKSYKLQLGSVPVKGFKTDLSEVSLNKQNGIDIAVGENHDMQLVYEIGIPLEELFESGFTPGEQVLTLNVSVNAMSRPTNGGDFGGGRPPGGAGGPPGGGMHQGGGGMPGGMPGGQGPGGMAGGGQGQGGGSGSPFEQTSFKHKFRLAGN